MVSTIHNEIGLGSINTTSDYLAYLEMIHLVTILPTWSTNPGVRVRRHPKVYVADTGLAAGLLGSTPESLVRPTDRTRGQMFETFVVNEIRRQSTWSDLGIDLFHYRDRYGREMDLIYEAPDGRIVGLEVKDGATVRTDHAAHLAWLRDRLGDRFTVGVVLYTGALPLPLGDRIMASPSPPSGRHDRTPPGLMINGSHPAETRSDQSRSGAKGARSISGGSSRARRASTRPIRGPAVRPMWG